PLFPTRFYSHSCHCTDRLEDFLSYRRRPFFGAFLCAHGSATDHVEITFGIVETSATGNRAGMSSGWSRWVFDEKWNHPQILVPVAGRAFHGGVAPTANSMSIGGSGQYLTCELYPKCYSFLAHLC